MKRGQMNDTELLIGDQQRILPKNDGPKLKHRIKYIWRDVSDDPELDFVIDINGIMDMARNMAQVHDGEFVKAMLKKELAPLGWVYNNRATFWANFPFGSKHVVFDSSAKLDADDVYRIKVTIGRNRALDYKLMRRVMKL